MELLFVLLELLGGSWLQRSASALDLLCAGLLGFWEDEDSGGGGSISFLEFSEEGLGVFVLEDSVWEDEDDAVCDLSSLALLLLCSFSGSPCDRHRHVRNIIQTKGGEVQPQQRDLTHHWRHMDCVTRGRESDGTW